MKKKLMVFAGMLFFVSVSYADWINDAKNESEKLLEPLAGDIGAVLGGGIYGPTKSCGLLGFDLGVRVATTEISDDNPVMTSGDSMGTYWIYASKGIPVLNVDVFARTMQIKMESSDDSIALLGFGVEYNLIKDKLISALPGVSLIAAINTLSVTSIDARTTTIGATVSKKLPFISPYVSVGRDTTEMSIDTGIVTWKPEKSKTRLVAGIELRPLPFVYANLGVSKAGSETGVQLGVGIKN